MKIEDIRQLSAENLRVIILALKMEEFNIDDEKVKNEVCEKIRSLPSAERINIVAADDRGMDELRSQVGYICELIDKHDIRDLDYKTRYRARTGLNPRYKVLD